MKFNIRRDVTMTQARTFATTMQSVIFIVALLCFANISFSQTKIMLLGDSITKGVTGSTDNAGFRNDLAALLDAEGVSYDFVGTQSDGSGFDTDHEGWNGYTADEILAHSSGENIDKWLPLDDPDIVLLHIGTNDISGDGEDVQVTTDEIAAILQKIKDYNPNIKIILSSIIPRMDSKDDKTTSLNALIEQLYYDKRSEGFNIFYAGHNEVFKTNANWATDYYAPPDSIHPDDTGYGVMGGVYFNAVMNAINSTDITVTDNFERSTLGTTWDADPEIIINANGDLENTATTGNGAWEYMATYKAQKNPNRVSMRYSPDDIQAEMFEGGLALRLNKATRNASGYLAWIRSDNLISLWTITNGQVDTDLNLEVASQAPAPQPGDVLRVDLSTDASGHHFDYYVNDTFAGTITDAAKNAGNGSELYAGIILRHDRKNDIEDFSIFKLSDTVSPDQVTDLSAGSPTATTVPLSWTATGDDGSSGNATSYELKYSTELITDANFGSATLVPGIPAPSAPGTLESFTVSGLSTGTTYYFALKVLDDAGNVSPLSNVVSVTTNEGLLFVDNFDRASLGSDWTAHPGYQIVNNQLSNTSTTGSWDQIAILNARMNPGEVSFKWAPEPDANSAGIDLGGFAFVFGSVSTTGNGYAVTRRTTTDDLRLWTLENGTVTSLIDKVEAVDLNLSPPSPGDEVKVIISSDANGNHFAFYKNGVWDGTVSDASKIHDLDTDYWSGVTLKENLNNNIDDFAVLITPGAPSTLQIVDGDSQQDTVGQTLPQPFKVKLSDDSGIPVVGAHVDFVVTAGNGSVDVPPPSENVILEAENGNLTGVMSVASDGAASNGKYINLPEAGGANNQAGDAEYSFTVSEAGDYIVWGRILAPNGESDSFFLQMNDGPVLTWLTGTITSWGWGQAPTDPASFNLAPGTHTLRVKGREDGTKLDQIVITKDPNFVPTGIQIPGGTLTDDNGVAMANFTLGTVAGVNNVQASFSGVPPVTFTATGLADSAETITKISGDNQTAPPGTQLANPFVVEVKDQFGNVVKNSPVNYNVTQGNGSLSKPNPVLTDTIGQASNTLTMATDGPNNEVTVVAPGVPGSILFTATPEPGNPSELAVVSGDNQTGQANQALPESLKVKVMDLIGVAINNHPVTFEVKTGGGKLNGSQTTITVNTDVKGIAKVQLTLGPTIGGSNTVEASSSFNSVPLNGSPYTFQASAVTPSTIAKVDGDNQTATAGQALSAPFRVKVTSGDGTPVAGFDVTFAVTGGGGNIEGNPEKVVATDNAGIAAATLTLGPSPGASNTAQATAASLSGSPVNFTANAANPQTLDNISSLNLNGTVNMPLPDSVKVQVLDALGSTLSNYPVTFTATQGGGKVNGSTNPQTVNTDANGIAKVQWSLGPTAGTNNNKLQSASTFNSQQLDGSPIEFGASAGVGSAANLVEISGNNQSGLVTTTLANPFVVKITDGSGNVVTDWPVKFTVTQGGGNLAGQTTVNKNTDSNGEASVTLTLGGDAGTQNNVVEASSENSDPLNNSPILFKATGEVPALVKVSGDSLSGLIQNPLAEPFVVKLTDGANQPVPNWSVTFTVTAGGGNFGGQANVTKTTDASGQASATLTLGSTAGTQQNPYNNVVEVTAEHNSTPTIFRASAKTTGAENLTLLEGDNQPPAPAGQMLSTPIKVKVTDGPGNAVPDHPVTFKIIGGKGTVSGTAEGDTVDVVNTNASGEASVNWYLGGVLGTNEQRLRISSNDGLNDLNGSPVIVLATATAGAVDADSSTITADANSVPADGSSKANITVTLTDRFGNPVSGKAVILNSSGENNFITQPGQTSDANGRVFGSIASTKAELKTITAKNVSDGFDLNATVEVMFTSLQADRVTSFSGNQQTANVGTALQEPLVVLVTDKNNNPTSGVNVEFVATGGGGFVLDPKVVKTDGEGKASAMWVLGTDLGSNKAEARVSGLNGSPVVFTATAANNAATTLTLHDGDNQEGVVAGTGLPNPLEVRVTDAGGLPVWNVTVNFAATAGSGSVGSEAATTDYNGIARSTAVLGPIVGTNVFEASNSSLANSPVTFTFESVVGAPAIFEKVQGDGGSGEVNSLYTVAVRVTDINTNPVEGTAVNFEVVAGNATIESQSGATNANGRARADLRLPTAIGVVKVKATAEELPNFVKEFTVHVTSASAKTIAEFGGNNQEGTVGRELVYPLQVLVTDNFGNPVAGREVTWVTQGGSSVNPQTSVSNESGVASTYFTIANLGENLANANALGLSGSPVNFSATGVNNNYPLFINLQDTVITEGQLLEFQATATDDDGDPITYEATDLPSGASFDVNSHTFSWRPGDKQAGEYKVTFIARDNRGGLDVEAVAITVVNSNSPPVLLSHTPEEFNLPPVRRGQSIIFNVEVTDPDGDAVLYTWRNEGTLVSTSSQYEFISSTFETGSYTVTVDITDTKDSLSLAWNFDVITSVELATFSAEDAGAHGVKLSWVTSHEIDNAGFNVLRSRSEDGEFVKINDKLIPPNENGEYQFSDGNVHVGQRYYYKLEDVDINGIKTEHGPIFINVNSPKDFELSQNYPNPFNPETRIKYQLPNAERVVIKIYDVLGREVRTLVDDQREAGYHEVLWDGRDNFGIKVSSGIFYYRIIAGEFHQTKKMLLLK